MLPSRTYKPKNFDQEVKRIQDTCTEIEDVPLESATWKDKDGNTFKIDYVDWTITVN